MDIGIIGAGHIGGSLARRLAGVGHTVRFADVHVDYTSRTEASEILAALDRWAEPPSRSGNDD